MDKKALDQKKRDEADVRNRLKRRAQQGRTNVVQEMLRHPDIQRTLMRQSLETAVFVSCLLIGVLTMVNALKEALRVSWQADMVLGVALIIVFLVYLVRKLR